MDYLRGRRRAEAGTELVPSQSDETPGRLKNISPEQTKHNGEARTRTGDTTIFRRDRKPVRKSRFAGLLLVGALPQMSSVCRGLPWVLVPVGRSGTSWTEHGVMIP